MNIAYKIYSKIVIILLLFWLLFTVTFFAGSIFDTNKLLKKLNWQYNKTDIVILNEELCEILSCTDIRTDNDLINFDKNIEVYRNKVYSEYVEIYGNFYLDLETYSIVVYFNHKIVYIDLFADSDKSIFISLLSLPFVVIVLIVSMVITIRQENEDYIRRVVTAESQATNKSMIMITENIHHELNTPLEVIENKVEKIKREFVHYLANYTTNEQYDRLSKLDTDFEFIKTSTEQVYAVLEKMKGFKHLKYSNGNKNIYDIIEGGFKIIGISHTDFDYNVSENLKLYKIMGVKNAEFLSIILNHIKNSIEAHANNIIITENGTKGDLLRIRIIDNGNGIPKEFQKNLFKSNFSTKAIGDEVRGNGMSINKYILEHSGGGIRLINSTNNGTTIELLVKFKRVNKECSRGKTNCTRCDLLDICAGFADPKNKSKDPSELFNSLQNFEPDEYPNEDD